MVIPVVKWRCVIEGNAPYDVRPRITGPDSAVDAVRMLLAGAPNECLVVLCMDTAGAPINISIVSEGGLACSIVEPRAVFRTAILANAASVILAHNHPSDNPEPSADDLAVTAQLAEAGRIMGIPVRDHLIVTSDAYTSLAELGYL